MKHQVFRKSIHKVGSAPRSPVEVTLLIAADGMQAQCSHETVSEDTVVDTGFADNVGDREEVEQSMTIEPDIDIGVSHPKDVLDHESTSNTVTADTSYKRSSDTCDEEASWVEMHVSSAHLVQSSKYFETLLTGPFAETKASSVSDVRRIPLKEVAIPPCRILMNIIHNRTNSLPERVQAETLYQLCLLIDMWEVHEATALLTDRWFTQLRDQIPQGKSARLRHWTFICHVLHKPEQFQALTALLQRHYVASMPLDDVPLPASFDGKNAILVGRRC